MSEHIKKEDIDFEIAFYSGLIAKKPDFIEALIALGDLYAKAGMYKESLSVDEKLGKLKPKDPIVQYNLACSYSLLNDIENAFRAVKKAVKYGYSDFTHLEQDSDLSNLRGDQRFVKYLARAKAKQRKNKDHPSGG